MLPAIYREYTSEFAASCQAALMLSTKVTAHLYQVPDHSVISVRLLYLSFSREMFNTEPTIPSKEHQGLYV